MKDRYLVALAIAFSLSLTACEAPDAVPGTISSSTPLDTQLEASAQLNQDSARNNLTQARNIYFDLNGQLQNVNQDVTSYRRLTQDLLPSMLAVANSLGGSTATDSDTTQLKADFQELFSDVVTQAIQGINTNLSIYQGQIESAQMTDTTSASAEKTLPQLTALFQACDYVERFASQLSQFTGLLTNGTAVLNGIRNQQNVVINGVLQLAQRVNSTPSLQSAYQTLVQTLTRTELLAQLAQLAQKAYGESNVAVRSTQLTPIQTDPNQIQMVVREDQTHYRILRIVQSRLSNELLVDTRGLSASDWLHASNVVALPKTQP